MLGIFDHNSEPFTIRDNWLEEPNPRRPLIRPWTGTTTVFLKSTSDGNEPSAQPPTGDTATGAGSSDAPGAKQPTTKPSRKATPGEIFVDEVGTRWKGDAIGRWYQQDESGSRATGSERPAGVSSKAWNKMSPK